MQRYLSALLFVGGICCAQPQIIYLPPLNLAATETAESAIGGASNLTIGDDRRIFSATLPYGFRNGRECSSLEGS
jgi:hypothetical protein